MVDETSEKDRSLWQFTRDEQRVLLITFAGGLGSIIIGAAVIGLAIALAKYERTLRYDSLRLLEAVLSVIAWACLIPVESHVRKRRKRAGRRIVGVAHARAFLVVSTLLIASVVLLWPIGIAAGIH